MTAPVFVAARMQPGVKTAYVSLAFPCGPPARRWPPVRTRSSGGELLYTVAALDSAPEWTLDQAAGLVFGFGLVALYFSSKLIDDYVAISQRRQLGICEKCGGLNEPSSCAEQGCPERT